MQNDKSVTEAFQERAKEMEDTDEQWQCLVEIFKTHRYVCECDVDLEVDDFWEILVEMAGVKKIDFSVKKEDLNADEDIYEWCDTLDEQGEESELCMAIIESEDGNEAIFPCNMKKLEELTELAKEIAVSIIAVAEF